jgi:alpha-glucosidase (family GH31 glycosyl hydrolase)
MGIWTDMRTGAVHKGKQTCWRGAGLPIYAKNGTIVPLLQPDGTLQLHYMPRLGAEFFISEPGDTQPSQVHAARGWSAEARDRIAGGPEV